MTIEHRLPGHTPSPPPEFAGRAQRLCTGFVVVREEGGEFEYLPYTEWRREVEAGVPIFGVSDGVNISLYDRIIGVYRWSGVGGADMAAAAPAPAARPADAPGQEAEVVVRLKPYGDGSGHGIVALVNRRAVRLEVMGSAVEFDVVDWSETCLAVERALGFVRLVRPEWSGETS